MRVYCFSPQNGIYQGEDFFDGDWPNAADGVTDIAPPPYRAGEVPVFDVAEHAWTIVPTASLRTERGMDVSSRKFHQL